MIRLTLANVIAYGAQAMIVAAVGGTLLGVFRTQPANVRYQCWRALLALCLALPWLQTPSASLVVAPEAAAAVASLEPTPVTTMPVPPISPAWFDWIGPALLAGVVLRLAWLAIGCLRLAKLRRRGQPAIDPRFDELADAIGVRAELRYVSGLAQPVMFGVRRPIVLLPERLRDADEEIRVAVAAHELWHARRRDWLSLVVEEIVRAALWFQPAVWWLIARVRASREEVVDSLAVAVTGRRAAYVRALMAFADVRPLAGAAAFGWKRHLFRRMVRIRQEDVMSSSRLIASLATLVVIVGWSSWSAVRAFPLTTIAAPLQQAGPGPIEQIAKPVGADNPPPQQIGAVQPVFPDDPGASDLAATIGVRATVDQSGAVAEARVIRVSVTLSGARTVQAPDGAAIAGGSTATLTVDGDDALAKLEAYFERVAARFTPDAAPLANPRFRPAIRAFIDSAVASITNRRYVAPDNGPVTFDLAVMFNRGRAVASGAFAPVSDTKEKVAVSRGATGASPLAAGALRVGGSVAIPTKIRDVRPVYPPAARDAGIQGVVILEVRIEGDGRVSKARVLRSIPELDQAAIEAVSQWEFTPTLLNGAPTPVVMTVTIQFSL